MWGTDFGFKAQDFDPVFAHHACGGRCRVKRGVARALLGGQESAVLGGDMAVSAVVR